MIDYELLFLNILKEELFPELKSLKIVSLVPENNSRFDSEGINSEKLSNSRCASWARFLAKFNSF